MGNNVNNIFLKFFSYFIDNLPNAHFDVKKITELKLLDMFMEILSQHNPKETKE